MADHSEYWGGWNNTHCKEKVVWYGDKTDWHVGFRKSGKDYHLSGPFQWDVGGFYRHRDSRDRLIFQHAAHCKGQIMRGETITNLVGNDVVREAWAIHGDVPWADGSDETDQLINPFRYFDLGAGHSLDLGVWQEIVIHNEYRLPPAFAADDIVIDIGGNVGAFAYAALRRGSQRVLSVEPFPGSYAQTG